MNMLNVTEYTKLQRESTDQMLLVKKVGRVFSGPSNTMQNMKNLIYENGIPACFVDKKFVENPSNKSVTETLRGIQIRDADFGFDDWKTVYTPVGYIMKADNILNHLRDKLREAAVKYPESVRLMENSSVCKIDRKRKTVLIAESFSDSGEMEEVKYDKVLLTAGPWTNSLLSPEVTSPPLSQLPLAVSNEQTQDFDAR